MRSLQMVKVNLEHMASEKSLFYTNFYFTFYGPDLIFILILEKKLGNEKF